MLRKKVGFTLVEMLIVVVIIGILAAALIPRLTGAQARARDAARQGHLNQLATALSTYFSDNGEYPDGLCVNDLKSTLVPTYLKSIPNDPQAKRITYGTKNGGCTNGNYAYTRLVRNGAEKAGMVLIANTESPGKNSNWVLRSNSYRTKPSFSGAATTIDETVSNTDGDYLFKNADKAEGYVCKAVTIDPTKDNNVVNCVAKENPAMVYVVFQ